jgi:predicted PurR-regulated permease PerM|tara:strand:- start:17177 stop:18346 length:1170 start_codon:yes stop_codon:yes gene_type:complete
MIEQQDLKEFASLQLTGLYLDFFHSTPTITTEFASPMTLQTPPSPLFRSFLWLGITVTVFFILFIGQKLIIPFILAIFIWYLINVLSFAIMKLKIGGRALPASLRYIASVLLIVGILSVFFTFITKNVSEVIQVAPEYQAKIEPMIDKVYGWLPFEKPPPLKEFAAQFDFSGLIKNVAGALGSLAGNAGLISIYVMFLFLEQRSFGPKIKGMARGNIKETEVLKIIEQIDRDTRKYIGIKTFSSLTTALLSYGVMTWAGLDFAAFWALLIFFFNFIPTVGSILATVFPSILALIQFESPSTVGLVIGGILATQILVGNLLEPRLMGNSLNLSPLVILLSLGLWGSLWGVSGMFLCVPITVIAMIICSHFPQTRSIAVLLSGNGQIKNRL